MNGIELKKEGRRVYVVGNTFPIKSAIKDAGGHWDADRKAWWIGAGKVAEIEKAIENASDAPKEPADPEIMGKVRYEAKTGKVGTYFIAWHGRTKNGDERYRLVNFDGSVEFFADPIRVEVVKHYSEPMKLSSLRRFVESKKAVEKGGECPRCASMMARGKWGHYSGSGDYEDCSLCGSVVEVRF